MIERIPELLLILPILFFSVVIHECAHGLAALRLGDPTAKRLGRITLNPIPHIDPFGTILLPAILWFSGSPLIFAAAKPVPIVPQYFKNPMRDQALATAAGPGSNIVLAICFLIVAKILISAGFASHAIGMNLLKFVMVGIQLNLILANFNLIPIPPLDGSWILLYFLPEGVGRQYARIGNFGFLILIGVMYLGILSYFFIPYRYALKLILQVL
jgi:Zn-dependent protease